MTANRPPRWWTVIDWRTVVAAGLPAWFLVIGVVAWAKLAPKRGPAVVHIDPTPAPTIPPPSPPPIPVPPEVAPRPRIVLELAGMPRPFTEEAPEPRAALEPPADPRPLLNLLANLFPPTAAPVAKLDPKPAGKPVPEGCKTHGTSVHFVKSTLEAVKQAKAKDKLVFVLHLSGNIEDDGFT